MNETHSPNGFVIKADIWTDGYMHVFHPEKLTYPAMVELMQLTGERVQEIQKTKVPGLRLNIISEIPNLELPGTGDENVKKHGIELFHWPVTIFLITKNPLVEMYSRALTQRTTEGFMVNRNYQSSQAVVQAIHKEAQKVVEELAKLKKDNK
jgi:hypothetical protein